MTTVSQDGVTVERRLEWKDTGVVGKLDIWTAEDVVTVTVVEELPEALPVEAVGFKEGKEPDDGSGTDRAVRLTQTVSTEPTQVVYGVKLSGAVDGVRFGQPAIESVDDVDFVWTQEELDAEEAPEADAALDVDEAPDVDEPLDAEEAADGDEATGGAGPNDADGATAIGAPQKERDEPAEPATKDSVEGSTASTGAPPPEVAEVLDRQVTDESDARRGGIFSRFRQVYGRQSRRSNGSGDRHARTETDGGSSKDITVTPVETSDDTTADATTGAAEHTDHSGPQTATQETEQLRPDVDDSSGDTGGGTGIADGTPVAPAGGSSPDREHAEARLDEPAEARLDEPAEVRLEKLHSRVREVAECVDALDTVEELESDVDSLSARAGEHEEAVATLQETVLTLETKVTALEETVRTVRREQETMRAELDELHAFRESLSAFFAERHG